MLIDSQQIGAFYDAVVGPAFRTVELQISAERTGQVETSITARLGAKLTALFPWLRVDADTEGRRTTTKGRQEGENIVLQPVESATRQLVELSLHYLVNQHDRIRGGRPRWVLLTTAPGSIPAKLFTFTSWPEATTTPACSRHNLIRWGKRHGLRIVGRLKSQPALNALAIYEK